MNERTRYRDLDLYKGVGIIIVICAASHMLSTPLQRLFDAAGFAIFMAAAGALWHKRGFEQDEWGVFKDMLRSIFMPYFWFCLAYLLIDALGMFIAPSRFSLAELYAHIWDSVSFIGISTLWFLPAYFLAVGAYRLFRHYFSFGWMLIVLSLMAFALLFILYYRGYAGLVSTDTAELSFENYGLRIALLFWRGCVGMFFCMWGEALSRLSALLDKHKLICVIAAILTLGAGIALSFFAAAPDYEAMVLGDPLTALPEAMCLSGGLYMLCAWIGTVRPLDFLGRHAIIILVSYDKFKVLYLALALGGIVLRKTDNNFATRSCVALVTLALELVIIFILRQKPFGIFFGQRRFDASPQEDK